MQQNLPFTVLIFQDYQIFIGLTKYLLIYLPISICKRFLEHVKPLLCKLTKIYIGKELKAIFLRALAQCLYSNPIGTV